MSASDGVDTTQKRALRESSAVPSERANFARIASDFNTSDNESGEKCCDVKHEVMSGLEFENASQTHSDCKSNEKAKNQKKDFYDLEDARKRQFSDTYVPGDGLNSQPGEVVEEDDDDDDSTTISDINSDDDFDLDGESVSMSDSDADSTVSSGTSSYRSSADSLGRRGSYDFLAASVAATNDDNLSESGGGDVGDDNDEEDEEFFDAENGEAHNKLEHSSAVSMTVSHPNELPDKQTLSVSEQNNSGLVDSSSYSNASIQSNNESSGNDSECSPQKLEEHSKNNSSINMSDEKKEKSFSIDVSARTEPSSESDNAHESGAMSPMLSLDVIEGFSLSQAWVDRVNRSLAENVQPRVTTTGEELARSAVVRRIMKRFSEKGDSKSARPSFIAEGLRKTSSDKRPDRNTGVRNKSQVSRQGLQPLYGIVYNSKPRTQSYKRACSVPAVPSHIVEQLSPSHSSDQSMEHQSNDSDAPDKQSSSQQIKTTQEPSACISKGKSNRRPAQQTSSSRVSLQATLPTIIDTSPQGKRPRAEGDIESLIGASYLSDNHAAVSVSVNDRSLRKSPHPVAECPVAHVSSGSEDESHSGRSTPTPSQTDHEDVKQGYNGSGYGRRENSISEEDSGKADVMDYTNSSREATTDVDSSVASVTTQDKETDSEEEDKSDILSHGLIRKPAVRRKGYAWVSKSLPKNADSDYKKQRLLQQQQQQGSKGRKLQRVKEGRNCYRAVL